MHKSESIASIATALSQFQSKVSGASKSSDNPFYKSRYADLAEIWKTAREHLSDCGLSVTQTTDDCEKGNVCVETILMHSSGEWISGRLTLPIAKPDPQQAGSAITYARRYALAAILGIHQEDDDAETHRNNPEPKPAKKEPKQHTQDNAKQGLAMTPERKAELVERISSDYVFIIEKAMNDADFPTLPETMLNYVNQKLKVNGKDMDDALSLGTDEAGMLEIASAMDRRAKRYK